MITVFTLQGKLKQHAFCAIVFCLLLLGTETAYTQWQVINTGTNKNLVKCCFTRDSTGFAISDDGLILKTTDFGNTWNFLTTLPGIYTCIFNTGPDTIFAGGDRIYWSTDGGNSWTLRHQFQDTLIDMGFFNSKNGYVLFPAYYYCVFGYTTRFDLFTVYKTNDFGLTWNYVSGDKDHTSRFQFIGQNCAYLTGSTYDILYHCVPVSWYSTSIMTKDGGNLWTSFNQPYVPYWMEGGHFLYSFINADTGFFFNPAVDSVYKTGNSCASYTSLYTEVPWTGLEQVKFLSEIDGYLLFPNEVAITKSGGFGWKTDYQSSDTILNNIYLNQGNYLFITGSNGTILKKKYIPSTQPDTVYRIKSATSSIDFGLLNLDDTLIKTLSFSNTGSIPSTYLISTKGSFLVSPDSISYDTAISMNLVPFQNNKLYIMFHPLADQVYQDTLSFRTAGEEVADFPLNGTGVTGISGNIAKDTVFCSDTLRIIGDVDVLPGVKVVVCPGTFVKFFGNYTLGVQGSFKALGDSLHPVGFGILTDKYATTGIELNAVNLNDTSIFSYCNVLLPGVNTFLQVNSGRILMDNSIINMNGEDAIICQGGNVLVNISNSEIFNCRYSIDGYPCDSLMVSNCNIHDNYRGIWSVNTNYLLIVNNFIHDHQVQSGIFLMDNMNVVIQKNRISNNYGGIYYENNELGYETASIRIENNEIFNNSSSTTGGICGVMISSPNYIVQNLVYNNTATSGEGGGICLHGFYDCPAINLISNTVCNNTAFSDSASELYISAERWGVNLNVYNNIYYNISNPALLVGWGNNVFLNMDYNCIAQQGLPGNHNITGSPLFSAATTFSGAGNITGPTDWSLLENSPCINAGDTGHLNLLLPLDFVNEPRIYDSRVDMGAYEYQHSYGINEAGTGKDIILRPNPVEEVLFIDTPYRYEMELEICDNFGRPVIEMSFNGHASINMSRFPGGIYYYRIQDKTGGVCKGKLLKL